MKPDFLPRVAEVDYLTEACVAWRVDVATDDLAYMMALHWFPDHRRRFERHLLDHYHTALIANGGDRLRPARPRRRLPLVGAVADGDAGVAGGKTISHRRSGGPTWSASSWRSKISAVASPSPCDVATLE
jgi:hypothetical protein